MKTYLIFLDESGFTNGPDWKSNINNQPYYVLSAVAVLFDNYSSICKYLRDCVNSILSCDFQLGYGKEIKCGEIFKHQNMCEDKYSNSEKIIDTFLNVPKKFKCKVISVVINKQGYLKDYSRSQEITPWLFAITLMYERIEYMLGNMFDDEYFCICNYDFSGFWQEIYQHSDSLFIKGSKIYYRNYKSESLLTTEQPITRILEVTFGNSKNSIGLQVADFFSHTIYEYFKDPLCMPKSRWDLIQDSFDTMIDQSRDIEVIAGAGLKVYPKDYYPADLKEFPFKF